MIGKFVIVRTYSAGIHAGVLLAQEGKQVTLGGARRIWRWYGANTLNEISLRGCESSSRISEPVAELILTEAIEIIGTTPQAQENLSNSRWPK
jgi:hypothetical protein